MANLCGSAMSQVVLALCTASLVFYTGVSAMGVNFGQVANNLPAPDIVLKLVQGTSLTKVKLYGADPAILSAFSGTGIDVVIGSGNDQIAPLAAADTGTSYALQWVQTNIVAYPNTSVVAVTLGNEVLSYAQDLMPLLLPAMTNLHAALVSLGLDQKIKISTPHSLGIVAKSFPPSYGEFHDVHAQILGPMLQFFSQTGAPFMVNAYPYFAYAANPINISLDYVLFNPLAAPVLDVGTGLNYSNMFDAQLDAVYAAIAKLGYNNVSITVTETGWPSAGDASESGASIANAQMYNYNLVKRVQSGVGTPARPTTPIDTFIFALYNEDLKPGPTSERNFGLYLADGTPIYDSGLASGWASYPPPPAMASPPETGYGYPPPPPPAMASPPETGSGYPPPLPLTPATPPQAMIYPPPAAPPSVGLPPPGPPPPCPPPPSVPASGPGTTPVGAPSWCVAKPDADLGQLQIGLDWACSDGGADCALIQPGATCYEPNTVLAHASFAYNSYFQLNNRNNWNCFFSDTGMITTVDPSFTGCTFP